MDRSVPITLDKSYELRFTRQDVKAIEGALGVGYTHFTRPAILGSVTALEVYLWRGLYQENEKGELIHVFPATDEGKEQAGDLLWSFMTAGGDTPTLIDQIIDGFCLIGICKRRTPETPKEEPSQDAPKNLPA